MDMVRVPMDELAEVIALQLEKGGRANLTVTGSSMRPLLRHGKDQVFLIPPDRLEKGDVILYRRATGAYVLHRIVKLHSADAFTCSGDNQWQPEPVNRQQVLAVVDGFVRGGRRYSLDHRGYRTYTKIWVWLFPVRRPVIALRRLLGKIKRCFCKHKRRI